MGFFRSRYAHLRMLLLPFRDDPEMERERRLKLVFFAAALGLVAYLDAWRPFLLLWMLPMYTVYPAILHLMDLTEHRWTKPSKDIIVNTRSTDLGAWRWLICDFHRPLHREHHLFPNVSIIELPRLSRLLSYAGVTPPPIRGFSGLLRDGTEEI